MQNTHLGINKPFPNGTDLTAQRQPACTADVTVNQVQRVHVFQCLFLATDTEGQIPTIATERDESGRQLELPAKNGNTLLTKILHGYGVESEGSLGPFVAKDLHPLQRKERAKTSSICDGNCQ